MFHPLRGKGGKGRRSTHVNHDPKLQRSRRAWGGDFTFLKNLQSNALSTGKSFQSNETKFPHPRLYIAVNPKAELKKYLQIN